jgi:type IV pilus assembly protein PilA
MQLKEKPELNQINEQSEFLAKTYQPYRPIKEPKSVAKIDRTNLQPIKEPKSVATTEWPDLPPLKERKSVATTDRQPREKLDLNQINQKLKVLVKTYRQDLQPIKEPKSVATNDRQDLRSIKNCKSVAKTYQPYFSPIKEHKSGTLRFIELSVVVIIIGILAHIALPSFLYCGNKAKQSEGKQYLGSMNRAQQAYFAEYSAFSNSITDLGIGIKTQTTNYNYSAIATKNAAFSYGVARSNNLRSYVGAVFLVPVSPAANDAKTTVSILCETTSFGKTQPPDPIIENGVPVCAAGTEPLTK